VQHAEALPRGGSKGVTHGSEDSIAAERRDSADGAEGDVDGDVAIVRRAAAMRNGAATRCRGSACARSAATPATEDQASLRRARHLETGTVYIKLDRKSGLASRDGDNAGAVPTTAASRC
jgi:hypothetical protein